MSAAGRDHDRLRLLLHESSRMQPLGQVVGQIVPMRLPLEGFAALSKHFDLARDQLIELRTLEPAHVAIDDEATPR
jgi:hypothetical protein